MTEHELESLKEKDAPLWAFVTACGGTGDRIPFLDLLLRRIELGRPSLEMETEIAACRELLEELRTARKLAEGSPGEEVRA